MFLEFILKKNRLFTLLKLGFASQNCGCIKPPEWPSPQPSPYPQPQPPLMGNPEPLRVAGGGPLWVHGATEHRVRVDSVDPPKL